jgi:hypothetical protein
LVAKLASALALVLLMICELAPVRMISAALVTILALSNCSVPPLTL